MKATHSILVAASLGFVALTTTSCRDNALTDAILDLECNKPGCTMAENGTFPEKVFHAIIDLERNSPCDVHHVNHTADSEIPFSVAASDMIDSILIKLLGDRQAETEKIAPCECGFAQIPTSLRSSY